MNGLWLPDAAHRTDLAAFVDRARRLDEAAVIRLRQRSDGVVVAWTATGFDVLAARVIAGQVRPADICAGADALARGLADADDSGLVEPGFPMDSAWRGGLPPDSGFVHVDDVPASAVRELGQRGIDLSKDQGAQGPPISLLDQEVIHVSRGDVSVGVPMRCIFALHAMGFVDINEPVAPSEFVRVRALPTWIRIDARFGSVFRRRGEPLRLM